MKSRRGVFPLVVFCVLFPALAKAEPNQPTVKMLHILVQMDKTEVSFENIWVFERRDANLPWEVSIDLPAGATAPSIDEPNETEFLKESGIIRKKMSSDSMIGTVGFSFIMPKNGDLCQTLIKSRYNIDSIVVFLSTPAVRFASNVLKMNEFLTKNSDYAGIYTADGLPAGAEIEINLKNLAASGSRLFEIICLAGFLFIVIIALVILRRSRGTDVRRETSGETCSK
jgi:hypothetical protein